MMSVESSRKALERAGIEPGQIDCVVVATVSHLMQTPAVATLIADELGTTPAAAFDISAACAGFCHAVSLGSDMIRSGSAKYVLAIGVERLSDITDPTDRGTAFIFADGAGAAVLGPSETEGIGPVVWGADGSKYDLIRQNESWTDVVATEQAADAQPADGRQPGVPLGVVRDGQGRPRGARPRRAVASTTSTCSCRTRPTCASPTRWPGRSSCPSTVVIARDIAHQGNTSAASIPLAAVGAARVRRGQERRHRPVHRLRRRPRLRRPGREAAMTEFDAPTHSFRTPCGCSARHTREKPEGAASMASTEEIRSGLADIVNEVAGIPADDVQLDKSFTDDLDVDSLSMVEVVVAAEEKFGVKIPDEEVKNLTTVGDAVAFIEANQSA